MEFVFDEEKNKKLFQQRGVTFEKAIEVIANGEILFDFKHPKIEQYPNQRIMVVVIENYPYCIPYIANDKKIMALSKIKWVTPLKYTVNFTLKQMVKNARYIHPSAKYRISMVY